MSPAKHVPTRRRQRRRTGHVTLDDVAAAAGVSAITASRALTKPHIVSAATIADVKAAVAKLGYVPNLLAGSLASNRSNLVIAIVPTVASPMFAGTIDALGETLGKAGFQLMLGLSGYSVAKESDLLHSVLSRRPAGLVLTSAVHGAETRARLLATQVPIVETWDLTDKPIGMVAGFSSEKVGRDMARHLKERGYRRPAFLTADDHRAVTRARAFVAEAVRLGLPEPRLHIVPAPTVLGNGRTGLAELLQVDPKIDAIGCSSDVLGLGVLLEAQARGLAVPRRLGVLGFGDLNIAAVSTPPLSTVSIDGAAIGHHAAEFILSCTAGRPPLGRVFDVGYRLVCRGTT